MRTETQIKFKLCAEKLEQLGYTGTIEEEWSWDDQEGEISLFYYRKPIDPLNRANDCDCYVSISNERSSGGLTTELYCSVDLDGHAYIYEEQIEKIKAALEEGNKDLAEAIKYMENKKAQNRQFNYNKKIEK